MVLSDEEHTDLTEKNVMDETPVNSNLYNKALLARAFDKQMNE